MKAPYGYSTWSSVSILREKKEQMLTRIIHDLHLELSRVSVPIQGVVLYEADGGSGDDCRLYLSPQVYGCLRPFRTKWGFRDSAPPTGLSPMPLVETRELMAAAEF
jgi:hypothetical protein